MNTETMSLRKALGQKKLLDKQIKAMMSEKFVTSESAQTAVIDGLPLNAWQDEVKANYQSLNDKIRRREALAVAIMDANVNNFVELPRFITLDEEHTGTEKVSFAGAIARKAYYTNELSYIVDKLRQKVTDATEQFDFINDLCERTIRDRMAQEFGTVNNASAKSREERETTLRKQYEAVFYDPADIVKKAKLAKERIENYLEEIDAILGNATEMTTITVTY